MKRLLCAITAALIILTALGGAAAAEGAGYPTVRIDPSTGQPWDLGGQTVYIYDYWTMENWAENSQGLTEQEQARYDYRTWIQTTYNCTVVTGSSGDWGTIADNAQMFYNDPDGSWRVYIVPPDFISGMNKNALADWNQSASINLSDSKWNSATKKLMTVDGKLLGTYVGSSEPRQLLYFNKRVLEEAGVDWNNIYDMQKNGTWTYSALENTLSAIHGRTDGEGRFIYGITGNNVDLFRIAVFSNGGSFFDVDSNGKLAVSANRPNTVYALNWAQSIWNRYARTARENELWDYYKIEWPKGYCGFYIAESFAGFADNSEMSGMQDPWGCVAFPKGPEGSRYVTIASNNITTVPNVYSQDVLSKITLIYDLWTEATPGYFNSDEWALRLYDYTDERAVNETYGMLLQPENTVADLVLQIGSVNDLEGSVLLWELPGSENAESDIERAASIWRKSVNEFNQDDPFAGLDVLILPEDMTAIEEEAFAGIDAEVVVIPAQCASIGYRAFADCPRLVFVALPASLEDISPGVFENCNPQMLIY